MVYLVFGLAQQQVLASMTYRYAVDTFHSALSTPVVYLDFDSLSLSAQTVISTTLLVLPGTKLVEVDITRG
jgi:hypothetical protein